MRLSAVDVLRSARARLAEPACWLAGGRHEAENGDARPCTEGAPEAVRWGLYGALVAAGSAAAALDAACVLLARVIDRGLELTPATVTADLGVMARIFDWHDAPMRTHPEVLRVLDGALALAEAETETAVS